MGRHRSRSFSPRRVSRSPPRRQRYYDPRERYNNGGGGGGGGGRGYRDRAGAPSGLLIRNISLDARPEDLRNPFERFGPVKDVYLPKNYYTGEPRGFGFVKFRYAKDAAVAKQEMNHQIIGGREISVVFAEEKRKSSQEMRMSSRTSERQNGGSYRRRSLPRSPKHRYRSYSHSPTPSGHDLRGCDRSTLDDHYSPHKSISPSHDYHYYRSRHRSPSPERNGRSLSRSLSYSPPH